MTLATAKKRGQTACPVCVVRKSNTYVYMTSGGTYYHSKSNCSGMQDASRTTLANAKAKGKKACPVCMKTVYYYATVSGKYYHTKSNCSGMQNATKITLASAKAKGKTACPVCVAKKSSSSGSSSSSSASKVYCYATRGGKYYHKVKTCSGMQNASKVLLSTAKKDGKTACPVCVLKKSTQTTSYADSKVACYATQNGKYYHADKTCSGIKNPTRMSVAAAKNKGKLACPVCITKNMRTYVYVTPAGLKYHRTATCSGMTNPTKLTLKTALARAYKPCTKCNAPTSN